MVDCVTKLMRKRYHDDSIAHLISRHILLTEKKKLNNNNNNSKRGGKEKKKQNTHWQTDTENAN